MCRVSSVNIELSHSLFGSFIWLIPFPQLPYWVAEGETETETVEIGQLAGMHETRHEISLDLVYMNRFLRNIYKNSYRLVFIFV